MKEKRIPSRALCLVLCLLLLCPSIAALPSCSSAGLYTATFFDVFDTVLTVSAASSSRGDAEEAIHAVHERILTLHRLFDVYHGYDGMNNLFTVNSRAGDGEDVSVDHDVIRLLEMGLQAYELSGGKVNICMGAVLSLWHDARVDGTYVPSDESLTKAAEHISPGLLSLDPIHDTVRLADPAASLDVGAIAKGFVCGEIQSLYEELCHTLRLGGLLVDLGGNVLALGSHPDGRQWSVGTRQPEGAEEADPFLLRDDDLVTVVTSGIDQRAYTVNGVTYHHLIDPDTLRPADTFLSVTVALPAENAALADALSTSLFLLSEEEGRAVLEAFPGACALWYRKDGTGVSFTAREGAEIGGGT